MWISYSTHLIDAFDTWNAVGWLLLTLMLYGVWRLWRGMRPDAFERGLRALREGRRTTVAFPRSRSRQTLENRQTGWLQVSLLPLMLISCAAAMLLAQAQRPDDVSRPATWALFVGVATWYGSRAWPHWRGAGPLRNHALAGVVSGVGVSALLWGFYLAVDLSWAKTSFTRVNASLPTLLWWTAVGGAIGAALGAVRASRIYGGVRARRMPEVAPSSAAELAIEPASRRRRVQWGALAMACAASLLFHLSATPHMYKKIDVRYWTWDWHGHPRRQLGPSLTLTMAPVSAAPSSADSVWVGYGQAVQPRAARQSSSIASPVAGQQTRATVTGAWIYRPIGTEADISATQQRAVVATRSIGPGEQVTRDSLDFLMVPVSNTDVVTDPRAIVGQYATRRLAPGQAIAIGATAITGPLPPVRGVAGSVDPLVFTSPVPDDPTRQPVVEGFDIFADPIDSSLVPLPRETRPSLTRADLPVPPGYAGPPGDPGTPIGGEVTDFAPNRDPQLGETDDSMAVDGGLVANGPRSDAVDILTDDLLEAPAAPSGTFLGVAPVANPLVKRNAAAFSPDENSRQPFDAAAPPSSRLDPSFDPVQSPPPAESKDPATPPVRQALFTTIVMNDGTIYAGLSAGKTDSTVSIVAPGMLLTVPREKLRILEERLADTFLVRMKDGRDLVGSVVSVEAGVLRLLINGKVVVINLRDAALLAARDDDGDFLVGPSKLGALGPPGANPQPGATPDERSGSLRLTPPAAVPGESPAVDEGSADGAVPYTFTFPILR